MYNGTKINFDMLTTAVRFKNTKSRNVVSCDKFTRGVGFKPEIKRNYVNC